VTFEPNVSVKRAPNFPELEGLSASVRWQLVNIAKQKYRKGRNGSRFFRISTTALIWLVGLGLSLEPLSSLFEREGLGTACVVIPLIIAGTVALAWGTSAWLGRMWLRMKVAELCESRACYRCDYPLPTETHDPKCPECGLVNDLRERIWWRQHSSPGGPAGPEKPRIMSS
jgi:hypothetical protein